jgi:hypothetical protein
MEDEDEAATAAAAGAAAVGAAAAGAAATEAGSGAEDEESGDEEEAHSSNEDAGVSALLQGLRSHKSHRCIDVDGAAEEVDGEDGDDDENGSDFSC